MIVIESILLVKAKMVIGLFSNKFLMPSVNRGHRNLTTPQNLSVDIASTLYLQKITKWAL